MKYLSMFIFTFLVSCSFNHPDTVNLYFCGGQSNANDIWYETIKENILKVDPTAMVIWNNHPGKSISYWWDEYIGVNYEEDYDVIKSSIAGLNYDFKGVFWYQGESDWPYPNEYKKRFYGLFNELEKDLNDGDYYIFMNIVYNDSTAFNEIRNVQIDIINNASGIFGYDTKDYPRLSPTTSHMPDWCYVEIGENTANIAIEILY